MEAELIITADLINLPAVREFVQEKARGMCAQEQFAYDLALAVDELVTNIIVHGYKRVTGSIRIETRIAAPEIEVTLCDDAPPFDPTLFPKPDIHRPLEKRQIGGLGIYLARTLTDKMIYHSRSGGGNELRLIKRCPVND